MIRACAQPQPKPILPKRLARVRRDLESKRMDSFRSLQQTLKQISEEEKEFIKSVKKFFIEEEEEDEF